MAVALAALGWMPETFWRATPAELAAAHDGQLRLRGAMPPPLSRADLEALKTRFPDRPANEHETETGKDRG